MSESLLLLWRSVAYLESSRLSKTKCFCKNSQWFSAVNYINKKTTSYTCLSRDTQLLCYHKMTKFYTPSTLVRNNSTLVNSLSCEQWKLYTDPLPTPYKHGKSCNFYIVSQPPVAINTYKNTTKGVILIRRFPMFPRK